MCLVCFFQISCKPLLIFFSGVKQPKIESTKSISIYLKKKKVENFDTLYICRDSSALGSLIYLIRDFPRTVLFDRNGSSILQTDTGYCPGKAEELMINLSCSTALKPDDRFSIQKIFQHVIPVDRNSEKSPDPDFTLLVFWAKYCGSLNKSVFRIMRRTRENQNIKTRIYLVNLDFMNTWDLKSMPKFSYR